MQKVQQWAADVIKTFTPLAEEVDLSFYPLQSEVKMSPKILFLGLNPAGGHSYKSQKENLDWEFDSKGVMTTERLLKGNPSFHVNGQTWPLIRGLRSIPYFREVLDEGDFSMMNYYYLASSSFNDVLADDRQKKMLELSKSYTYKFIHLVQPKMIIILGTANGIDKLDFKGKQLILDGISQRLLVKSNYQDIPVLAIPHPSMMMLLAKEIEALDLNIREIINGNEPTSFTLRTGRVFNNPNTIDLIEALKILGLNFHLFSEGIYDCIIPGVGVDKLMLRVVVHKNNRYWGLRPAHKLIGDWYGGLDHLEIYRDAIRDEKDYLKHSWVVRKELKNYGAKSQNELLALISEDFRRLIYVISGHKLPK
jgi:hypothetical protein